MAESEGGGGRARVDQGWKMTKLRPDVHKLVKAVSAERGETIQEYVQEALGRVAAGDHRRYIMSEVKRLSKVVVEKDVPPEGGVVDDLLAPRADGGGEAEETAPPSSSD